MFVLQVWKKKMPRRGRQEGVKSAAETEKREWWYGETEGAEWGQGRNVRREGGLEEEGGSVSAAFR